MPPTQPSGANRLSSLLTIGMIGLLAATESAAVPTTVVDTVTVNGMSVSPFGLNRVYWTEVEGKFETHRDRVRYVATVGGTPRSLDPANDAGPLETHPNILRENGSYVYSLSQARIARLWESGNITESLVAIPANSAYNLAVDDSYLWWNQGSTIYRAAHDGTAIHSLDSGRTLAAESFATAGTGEVYFIAAGDVFRTDVAGGVIDAAEDAAVAATAIAVDSQYLFWGDNNGSLHRTPIHGTASPVIADPEVAGSPVKHVAVDLAFVYWVEEHAGGNSTIRRTRRDGPFDVQIVADIPRANHLFQDGWYLFWDEADKIRRVRKDETVQRPDFFWQNDMIDVIQALTANSTNTIQLVAGKPTIVRVYPGVDALAGTQNWVTAELRGERADGTPMPGSPLRPRRNLLTVSPGPIDRTDPDKRFEFNLPTDWVDGQVNFTAVINPNESIPESIVANNDDATLDVQFWRKQPLCVKMKKVLTHAPGEIDTNVVRNIVSRAELMLPTPQILLEFCGGVLEESCAWGPCPEFELPDDSGDILQALTIEEIDDRDPAFCRDADTYPSIRVGMITPATVWMVGDDSPRSGEAPAPGIACLVKMDGSVGDVFRFDDPNGGRTLVHEMTHDLGYEHVNCSGDEAAGGPIDPAYPYGCDADGKCCAISEDIGELSDLGYDRRTATTIGPNDAKSYMTYSGPKWTDPYHWGGIFNQLGIVSLAPASPPPPGPLILLAQGTVDPVTGAVAIVRLRLVDRASLPVEKVDRQWNDQLEGVATRGARLILEARRADDSLEMAVPFAPGELHRETPITPEAFTVLLPVSPLVTQARIIDAASSAVRAARTRSANAPVVTAITAPVGGQIVGNDLTVTWTAADADGDLLSYTVQYSHDDGQTWQTLSTDLLVTTKTYPNELGIPGSLVPTQPGSSLVRVVASDGFNTGARVSSPFRVLNRPPLVMMTSPEDAAYFVRNEQIVLSARSHDPEIGPLENGGVYNWDIPGFGTFSGPTVVLENGLPPGVWTITLTGTDPQLLADSQSIEIFVDEFPGAVTVDLDDDGVADRVDNCPDNYNPSQADADGDGVGDVCDTCPSLANRSQGDFDDDGIGDECDPCPVGNIAEVAVSGLTDPGYGSPLAVQNTQTSAGNNTDPSVVTANGSELDALYAVMDCDMLHLIYTGNLRSSTSGIGDTLDIFIDSVPGGENRLLGPHPHPAITRMGSNSPVNGLTFDIGFTADYFFRIYLVPEQQGGGFDLAADYATLPGATGGVAFGLGLAAPDSDGAPVGAPSGAPSILFTINNTNLAGVTAGVGIGDGAGVGTGVEISIPLSAIGGPACGLKITAFINNATDSSISNQVLPGLGGGTALGEPRSVNFATKPGNQYVSVSRIPASTPVTTYRHAGPAPGFHVSAAILAPKPYTLEWRRNGIALSDDGRISGAHSPFLVINPAGSTDEGDYALAINQGLACPAYTTPSVHISCASSADTDGDGHSDLCDCAPDDGAVFSPPGEIRNLSWPTKAILLWDSDSAGSGSGTLYDVLSGALETVSFFGTGIGDLCLANNVTDVPFTDPSPLPAPGHGRYVLVRGDNVCGKGRYETASDGRDRPSTVCP